MGPKHLFDRRLPPWQPAGLGLDQDDPRDDDDLTDRRADLLFMCDWIERKPDILDETTGNAQFEIRRCKLAFNGCEGEIKGPEAKRAAPAVAYMT
jgi:hypothetical protein